MYKREVSWLSTDYLWLGLAVITVYFYAHRAEQDDAKRQLPSYDSHLSQMRQMAESNVQQKINTLEIMYQYGVAGGPADNIEYRSDITNLIKRIQAFTDDLQKPEWPNRMEQFFNCEELSAGLTSPTTQLAAKGLCESFEFVSTSRNERNQIAEKVENAFLSSFEIHVFPLIFALGLGIRLGRTTADVRRKRSEKKKPDGGVPNAEVAI
ncbi:hypothetical protein PS673_02061 [Pseudomonas fluorescens]|uniref:Uncharacterized protein n=2 Tax=Pseudomonas fluorescens TaxID=294 RepID=A0A5E6S6L8_PSEFL|nr:hypothetical protein PS673_02061 [Pseudomonas fluorescens]